MAGGKPSGLSFLQKRKRRKKRENQNPTPPQTDSARLKSPKTT